ncbi:MAG: methylenetetrahydrofolate reductase [Fibromonadaceae bacterium]|jgi:methylenetetrahydrofolate reductase (NADPH)|nr:methylenetetrahydrofolate reductase [Fibromonadaceae bacterium]
MQIALELVPRTLDSFLEESKTHIKNFPKIIGINIPELRSVEIKSFEASEHLLKNNVVAIPHFRLIDRSLSDLEQKIEKLFALGLKQVLLISGDPPIDMPNFVPSGVQVPQAIKHLKAKFPKLKVYAGQDPYRQSFKKELDYCKEKLDAGADGFFTQPFFSEGILNQWLEQLPEVEMWIGLCPVTGKGSRNYWETVNQVVFPPNFHFDLEGNCVVGRRILTLVEAANKNAYLMPITISAEKYLNGLRTF